MQLKNAGGLIPEGMYLTPQIGSLGGTALIKYHQIIILWLMIEFKGIYYVREGLFKGYEISFDLEFSSGYPHEIPIIYLHDRLPHPLLGSDQSLNISAFLQRGPRVSISAVLKAIECTFSKEGLQSLKSEQCVNLAVKHQYCN